MRQVNSIEWLVLNATADDAENLEQIYRCLAFECSHDRDRPGDPDAWIWREARPPILLSEIADTIRDLVARGLLIARWDPAEVSRPDDLSYVWKAWFEMTEAGRALWEATAGASHQAFTSPSAR
jgi:hypothetical protein